MKIKNIQPSLIVLLALTIASFAFFVSAQEQVRTTNNIFLDSDQDGLSDEEEKSYGTDPQIADTDGDSYTDGAEVKSGYDPLIKSPGDKLIPDATTLASAATDDPSQPNLTRELAHKISAVLDESNQNSEEISLDQIKSIVADSLEPQTASDGLPKIATENIKIKEQDYSSLSKEKAEEKRKEDFTNYIVGLSYILSSNSPEPITSTTDINSLTDSISSRLIGAITSGDISSLQDLAANGEKIMQQVQDIEVPEELADIHIKGLQLIQYAISLQDAISPNGDDPILDITNYSKMQNLVELMISYSSDVQEKFSQYGLKYDGNMQAKLADYGIEINPDSLENLTQE
ncbi:MAG: hypothetical protein WC120_00080 [Parcubacteria group bacterium]